MLVGSALGGAWAIADGANSNPAAVALGNWGYALREGCPAVRIVRIFGRPSVTTSHGALESGRKVPDRGGGDAVLQIDGQTGPSVPNYRFSASESFNAVEQLVGFNPV